MRRFTLNMGMQDAIAYPITFFTANDYYEQESVEGRNMPFHQILLVLDGKGTLHFGDKSYPLKRGCAFFTAKHTPTAYINEGGLISAFLTVKGSAADKLSEEFTDNGLLFIANSNLDKYVSLIKQLLYDYHNDCDQGKLSVQAYSIFVDFLSQRDSNSPQWLNEAVRYINVHFDKKLTLEEIAQHTYVSVSKLCHDFKKVFSVSVFEYIMNVRLQHAHALFQNFFDITTTDVANQCGFFNVGYFCKMYKKKYGKTPLEHRNISNKNTVTHNKN